MRKYVAAARCSQMSNPTQGTGSGGNRCSEAVVSMIDCTYRLGPLAKTIGQPGVDPDKVAEQIMFDLTKALNSGSSSGVPEDLQVWFPQWLKNNGFESLVQLQSEIPLTFEHAKEIVDRQHVAVLFIRDFSKLKTFDGQNPYTFPENDHVGHYVLLVGYDDDFIDRTGKHWGNTLILNDPLRADPKGMPWDYNYQSVKDSNASLSEVSGAALPFMTHSPIPPAPSPAPKPVPPKAADALCVDVSKWQGDIDWKAYAAWSRKNSSDNKARVIMRSSQGVGLKDSFFEQNWSGAVAAGVDEIVVYHYARPQDNSAQGEAEYFDRVVGSRLRPSDSYMLDFEENVPQATDTWVIDFSNSLKSLSGRQVMLYANLNMVQTRMHNAALASIPLDLARWTFDPKARPACPAPFKTMLFIQYEDNGHVPGISGNVDMDVFIGPEQPAPAPAPAPKPAPAPVPVDPLKAALAQIKLLTDQVNGLNATLAAKVGELAHAENQLAAEVALVRDLEAQIAALKVQKSAPDHDDLKTELLELSDGLSFLPEVKKFVDNLINKL